MFTYYLLLFIIIIVIIIVIIEKPEIMHVRTYILAIVSAFQDCTRTSLGAAQGGRLNDSSFSASSYRGGNYPRDARLNKARKSWCPSTPTPPYNPTNYLQVDLRETVLICAVATQGNQGEGWWTTLYNLQTSLDCSKWKFYISEGGIKVHAFL